MKEETFYYDPCFEHFFPSWRETSPEEFMAHNWLSFGALSISHNKFKDKEMEKWAHRVEEIFHSQEEIEKCRQQFLSPKERSEQDLVLKAIMEEGL